MVPPDGGSRILFFSGGTALAPVAAELSRHTRNAVHVITTFDSGAVPPNCAGRSTCPPWGHPCPDHGAGRSLP